MAGVAEVNRANLAIEVINGKHRQIVIDWSAFGSAIRGKACCPGAPRKSGWTNVFKCIQSGFLKIINELLRVSINVRLMRLGNRQSKKGRTNILEHWRGVRVRRGDGQSLALETN